MEHQNRPNSIEPASEEHLKAKKADSESSEKQSESQNSQGSKKLSKEEQMAQFEEAMKNEDWGHQPC